MKTPPVLRIVSFALSILATESPNLQAGIIPISQARTIEIWGQWIPPADPPVVVDSLSESRTAPDFGLWDESVAGTFSVLDPDCPCFIAEQRSFISSTSVTATGSAFIGSPFQDFFLGYAFSHFDLTFEVETTEFWRLTAEANNFTTDSRLFLSRGSEPIVEIVLFGIFDQLIELTPGEPYRLRILGSDGTLSAEPYSTEYNLTFRTTQVIPEPGSGLLLGIGIALFSLTRRILTG